MKSKGIVHDIEGAIDTITASSLLIHAIMVIAAVASYGNIKSYLATGHTNDITAHALAIVLGVSLVVASSRLTKLNLTRLRTDASLQAIICIAIATGVVSGLLQMLEYSKTYGWVTSSMLGFGIPLLLEVAPALTVSLLKNIDTNERTNTLRRNMADKITDAIAIALEEINPDDMRKEVETAAQLFTREFVDNVAGEMIHALRDANRHKLSDLLRATQEQTIASIAQAMQADSSILADAMQAQKLIAQDARPAIADRVAQLRGDALQDMDIASQLKAEGYSGNSIAKELDVNPSTVSRWLKTIVQPGPVVSMNGAD